MVFWLALEKAANPGSNLDFLTYDEASHRHCTNLLVHMVDFIGIDGRTIILLRQKCLVVKDDFFAAILRIFFSFRPRFLVRENEASSPAAFIEIDCRTITIGRKSPNFNPRHHGLQKDHFISPYQ
ncbi:unnamed protein product [Dibothriocephalus latus]|uniref:Uncharacterized protein n=1 Tax=Dibothriocephalus latus TaxID=60516 RepID=A0A3P7Q591_DIBLA|nr:unnamed protein product [Dibothriocephalus latus]